MSKTRRLRQISAHIEDSRSSSVQKAPHEHYLGIKQRFRERWKETDEGRAEVDRLWAFWSADPTVQVSHFTTSSLGINSNHRPRGKASNSLSRRKGDDKRDNN